MYKKAICETKLMLCNKLGAQWFHYNLFARLTTGNDEVFCEGSSLQWLHQCCQGQYKVDSLIMTIKTQRNTFV